MGKKLEMTASQLRMANRAMAMGAVLLGLNSDKLMYHAQSALSSEDGEPKGRLFPSPVVSRTI